MGENRFCTSCTRFWIFERLIHRFRSLYQTFNIGPRQTLVGLSFVNVILSACLSAISIFLCVIFFDTKFLSGWVNWAATGVVSIFLVFVSIVGLRGANYVSLDLLLTFFWLIAFISIPLLLALFACFNFFLYIRIWFKHNWELPSFLRLRQIFCPPHTANNKCIAPLTGDSIILEDDIFLSDDDNSNYTIASWCMHNYNASDCEQIRNESLNEAIDWGTRVIAGQSGIGLALILLISFSIYYSYILLTSTVITQSMLDVINYFLLLPIAGCVLLAVYFWWIQDVDLLLNWFPILFLVLALFQCFALPFGIYGGRKKNIYILYGYISLLVLITLGFGLASGICLSLAKIVLQDFHPARSVIDGIACRKKLPGCSGCEWDERTCSEWDTDEILIVISNDLRLAGVTAALSILYLVGGLVVSGLTATSLKNYKTDFV